MALTKEDLDQIKSMMEKKPEEQKPAEPKPSEQKSDLDEELANAKKELELKKIRKEMSDLEQKPNPEEKKDDPNTYTFTVNGTNSEKQATEEDWKVVDDICKNW